MTSSDFGATPPTSVGPAAGWPPVPPAPSAPPVQVPPRRGGLWLGLLIGLVVGLMVGGLAGFGLGRLLDDDATISIGDGGVSTSGSDEAGPPSMASTREDPVPLDTPVDIGNGWRLRVVSFEPGPKVDDGFDPPAGSQWVTAYIEATYVEGEKEALSPFFGLDISFVGRSGVEYTQSDGACFPPDPDFDNLGDLYKGGTAAGNFCVAVGTGDVDSLVLVAEPSLSFEDHKSYFALR